MRLVIGAFVGLGMIAASFKFERGRYDTMRHTLAAGGIGVLYSVFFAATLYYGYLERPLGFITLVTVSAAAFVLAIFHRGIAISVLGGIGAYLTPLLVSTGRGNLLTLFVYLAIVNIGIYQVVKRLESRFLLLFSTIGTLFSLTCATLLASPSPEPYMIGLAWVGNLFVFAVFIDLLGWTPQNSSSTRWSAIILFLSIQLMALFVVATRAGCTPMSMMAAAITIAVALAYRNSAWHSSVIPYSTLTFLVAGFWALARFDATSTIWSFLAFFVYGLAGG
ncbi:MAG: Membrane protein-like protein, partial [uncultured bacterium]